MKKLPILLVAPHCSSFVPEKIRKLMNLSDFEIRYRTDLATERIFVNPKTYNLAAKFSRFVSDLNRPENAKIWRDGQPVNGILTIAPMHGKAIFREYPSTEEVKTWVQKYYRPFYQEVGKILPRVKFLLAGHSHWSCSKRTGTKRADIVLGDRNGIACDPRLTRKVAAFFRGKNFSVAVNRPFPGGFLLEKFCDKKVCCLQIEIKRALYLNEKTLRVRERDVARLNKIIGELTELLAQEI
ncbi:MAG: N-formylglutamate amidohydrolase [Patescibacteria group bacterium]